ncbi:hypothetical protein VPNG_07223 [Cytospora leucostoma]|uniref:Methyltransferase type 11 domain-containing protein n=1 Tax=Cytospora leucostoma TaxID=1230097 RepID=A0A423WJN7_9PEZI|nr:hypothetical protein VPNG_07223 [Cytospora leucostoma]
MMMRTAGRASRGSSPACIPQSRALHVTSRSLAKLNPNLKPSPKLDPQPRGKPGKGEARPLSELVETYKKQLVVFGLGTAVMVAYITMLISGMARDPCAGHPHDGGGGGGDVPSGRPLDLRSGKISAAAFDREQDWPEWLMGVTSLRKLMGGLCRGHVLEVAVGTGRNVEYVDWDEVKSTAPRPAPEGAGLEPNPRSAQELELERVRRRMEKGKKGLVLPGDDAPEVVSFTGVDVSADVLEVTWTKLKKAMPDLIPRRRRRTKEETEAQQQQQQQQQQQKQSGGEDVAAAAAAAAAAETKHLTIRNPLKALAATKKPAPAAQPAAATTTTTTTTSPGRGEPTDGGGEGVLAANIGSGRVRLFKSDAQSHLPPPPSILAPDARNTMAAPRHYDTVLQNFGLCSMEDPQKLLGEMARVVRPGSGRIYLLEHGRGWYDWINGLLDKFAPSHFERYGCWWNRDIEGIVRRAQEDIPGLEVVRVERPLWTQGGTMYWIELKVNPGREQAKEEEEKKKKKKTGPWS